jgi:hypothetical protein
MELGRPGVTSLEVRYASTRSCFSPVLSLSFFCLVRDPSAYVRLHLHISPPTASDHSYCDTMTSGRTCPLVFFSFADTLVESNDLLADVAKTLTLHKLSAVRDK